MTDTERKAGMGPTPWHPSASVKDQEFYDQLADAVGPAIVREMLNANKTEHDAAMAARRVVSDSYRALVQHVLDAAITKVRKAEATHSDLKAALEWQPIETAPKDGTFIDVWIGGDIEQRYTDVQWRKPTESELWVSGSEEPDASQGEYGPEEGFFDCHGLKLQGGLYPTHWRLPPEPPALSKLTGGGE